MVMLTSTGLIAQAHYTGFTSTSTYVNGWRWMGLGSGTSSEAVGNTALTSEFVAGSLIRSTCTHTYESTATSVWSHVFTSTTNYTVNELGLFDTSSGTGGHMFCRHVFAAAKSMVNTDTLTATIKIVQGTT